jgi:hypothetical protein
MRRGARLLLGKVTAWSLAQAIEKNMLAAGLPLCIARFCSWRAILASRRMANALFPGFLVELTVMASHKKLNLRAHQDAAIRTSRRMDA